MRVLRLVGALVLGISALVGAAVGVTARRVPLTGALALGPATVRVTIA